MSLSASFLAYEASRWKTSPAYIRSNLYISPAEFHSVTNALLANPNLNSSHLFRADILTDSAGELETPAEKERQCNTNAGSRGPFALPTPYSQTTTDTMAAMPTEPLPAEKFHEFVHRRSVVRRLIPRKPQLDRALEQSCHMYDFEQRSEKGTSPERHLVVYAPHVDSEEEMPWYHPPVKALAYLYEQSNHAVEGEAGPAQPATLSVHILLFPNSSTSVGPLPARLDRTLLSLLQTFVRLAKHPSRPASLLDAPNSLAPGLLKDTVIPQHVVQNTYTRLKETYAHDLVERWVEKTEPSKHVFEDLSIAAFLIELWRQMYQVAPLCERSSSDSASSFPGFVDMACGNGVLLHVLLEEGFKGWGFDARRRKTWSILSPEVQNQLHEKICVPQPFLFQTSSNTTQPIPDAETHNGIFPKDTFIISNHADQLTPWTPVLAALSCPEHPLPWLAIPCCSHALSGSKNRYRPPPMPSPASSATTTREIKTHHDHPANSPHPATGDLKALRAAKAAAAAGGDPSSTYACLTNKVVALAEEIGFEVDKTLMRIPSTRNIGIVGNRKAVARKFRRLQERRAIEDEMAKVQDRERGREENLRRKIEKLVERECRTSGGVEAAAKMWIEGARHLQLGKGRGKVNMGGPSGHT